MLFTPTPANPIVAFFYYVGFATWLISYLVNVTLWIDYNRWRRQNGLSPLSYDTFTRPNEP